MVLKSIIGALGEIDEIEYDTLPDGRVRVRLVTTGVHPDLTKIKVALWALVAPPFQKIDDITVTPVQGRVFKRYLVTATLSPIASKLTK